MQVNWTQPKFFEINRAFHSNLSYMIRMDLYHNAATTIKAYEDKIVSF